MRWAICPSQNFKVQNAIVIFMQTLSYLLQPYPKDKFFAENWQKQGIVISQPNQEKFQHLFSWKQLNYLLNFHKLTYPGIRFSLDGKTLPETTGENWLKHFQKGATMIIDRVDELVPELAEFTTAIHAEIGHKTQINLYCSPPEQQGFDCHYDTHEVFILQIHGTKEWYLFSDTIKYPLPENRSDEQLPPDESPYLKVILNPGDLLYIPRGHWHYALSLEQPSLHLTLGIDCHTGIDFLNWLIDELLNESEWRKNLPIIQEGNTAQLQEKVEDLISNLIGYLKDREASKKYADRLNTLTPQVAKYSLPFQAGFGIFDRGFDTQFTRPKYQQVRVEEISDREYNITVNNQVISLKGVPLELVENIFNRHKFSLFDLATWAPDLDLEAEAIPLLSQLVMAGIIFVETDSLTN
ncbi:cupin domain-containing protein [Floridanema aerugineum]|uniref:Cupin domain-containing protein n=1 Tax=Floridaenema aerugineum BLCC-F46 TaxID=3153654 RepID=A0ABV4X152_9CYAN